MKLTTYDISYILKHYRPKTLEEFKEFGLTLLSCGKGCSRDVYKLRGYNLVVKIPNGLVSSIRHSAQEMKAYHLIRTRKKYRELRKYLPKIHQSTKDGVILMDYYKKCDYGEKDSKEIRRIRQISDYLFPKNENGTDMYGENLGRDAKGRLHILDFGCFFSW